MPEFIRSSRPAAASISFTLLLSVGPKANWALKSRQNDRFDHLYILCERTSSTSRCGQEVVGEVPAVCAFLLPILISFIALFFPIPILSLKK